MLKNNFLFVYDVFSTGGAFNSLLTNSGARFVGLAKAVGFEFWTNGFYSIAAKNKQGNSIVGEVYRMNGNTTINVLKNIRTLDDLCEAEIHFINAGEALKRLNRYPHVSFYPSLPKEAWLFYRRTIYKKEFKRKV